MYYSFVSVFHFGPFKRLTDASLNSQALTSLDQACSLPSLSCSGLNNNWLEVKPNFRQPV